MCINTYTLYIYTFYISQPFTEGSLEAKLPTIWADGKAQPGRSTDIEKVRREKIRDGEDEEGRQPEERRCRCAER